MNFLEEAFVIIHIRLSGVKLYFLEMRTFVTILLILYLMFSLIQIYELLFIGPFTAVPFIQDVVYLLSVIYVSLLWVKSWSKANKHLRQALNPDKAKDNDDT